MSQLTNCSLSLSVLLGCCVLAVLQAGCAGQPASAGNPCPPGLLQSRRPAPSTRPGAVDWSQFFVNTLDSIHEPMSVVMRSPVCKGWLLGEFYYAGKNLDVRTDDYKWDAEGRLTADLSSGDSPAMIAEIKMALARNASVIEGVLDADAQRLRGVHTAGTQRFLILIIPADQADTEIGKRLRAASYSPKCIHRQWPGFSVRIWQF